MGSKKIGQGVKRSFTTSLYLSKLLYNAGTWPRLNEAHIKKLDGARVAAWRVELGWQNVGRDHGDRVTDRRVWQEVQQCSSHTLVAMARLRLFARVAKHAPTFLTGLIQNATGMEDSLAACVRADLHDLWHHHLQKERSPLLGTQSPAENPDQWLALAKHNGNRWKNAVNDLAMEKRTPPPALDERVELSEQGVCLDCGACFASWKALQSHRTRKRGFRHHLRGNIDGTVCACCFHQFGMRDRLLYHLKGARFCRSFYENHMPDLPEDQIATIDAQACQETRANLWPRQPPRHTKLPPQRCIGPIRLC